MNEPLVPESSRARIVALEEAARRLIDELAQWDVVYTRTEEKPTEHPLFDAIENLRRLL